MKIGGFECKFENVWGQKCNSVKIGGLKRKFGLVQEWSWADGFELWIESIGFRHWANGPNR